MDDEPSCRICGRRLAKDERGLNQKILEADAKRGFWRCLPCLTKYLECGEDELREKIEEFKAEGCKLFG